VSSSPFVSPPAPQNKSTAVISFVHLVCRFFIALSVNLGVDIDPACEYPYSANNSGSFLKKSVNNLSSSDIQNFFNKGSIKLLAGCSNFICAFSL
jgi:hypothetical protein